MGRVGLNADLMRHFHIVGLGDVFAVEQALPHAQRGSQR
jgi:hypothetical protein